MSVFQWAAKQHSPDEGASCLFHVPDTVVAVDIHGNQRSEQRKQPAGSHLALVDVPVHRAGDWPDSAECRPVVAQSQIQQGFLPVQFVPTLVVHTGTLLTQEACRKRGSGEKMEACEHILKR
jgi:hypothetical protein